MCEGGLVNGYCNAIRAHKKVRTLSDTQHGPPPLRTYTFDVDWRGEKRCIELFCSRALLSCRNILQVRWN